MKETDENAKRKEQIAERVSASRRRQLYKALGVNTEMVRRLCVKSHQDEKDNLEAIERRFAQS